MRDYRLFVFCITLFVVTAANSFGACHAVGSSAAGNGSGSDWNNRMNKLPGTLVRGDTYYLMDGNYGNYGFSTANSGATTITIKKAQSYDMGRISDGCPNDISAGWNQNTMGSGQALFTSFDSSSSGRSYFTIDGNGRSTKPGCGTSPVADAGASDCGIRVTSGSGDNGPFDIGTYTGFKSRMNNWTIRYVEWQGAGDSNTVEQNGIWCRDGCDNLLIDHVWWHESGTDFIKLPASSGAIVRNSHFKQNHDNSTNHGQFYIQEGNASNISFYGNVIQDIQGTGYWVVMTGGTVNGLYVYNNILLKSQANDRGNTSNGIFACINSGAKCTNVQFIANSVVNAKGNYSNQGLGINSENNNGSSYIWKNNLFYNTSGIGFNLNGASFTEDHNSWLNSGSPRNGSADVTVTSGAPNPFVDWQNNDFRLVSQNPEWGAGATLSSPFDVDMAGAARPGGDGVWNRGALEYGGVQGPTPPAALTTVVR